MGNNDYEPYKEFERRSVSGSSSSSIPDGYVSREKYESIINKANKKIMALFVASCISLGVAVPSVVVNAVPVAKDLHHKHQITDVQLDKDTMKFRKEVIDKNMFRDGDDQHVEYNYHAIEEALHTYGDGDYDKNVYLAFSEAEYQKKIPRYDVEVFDINSILANNSDYNKGGDAFKNYLKAKNCYEDGADINDEKAYKKAVNNYKDMWEAKIIIEDSINVAQQKNNEKMDELNQMLDEHNLTSDVKDSTLRR